MNSVRRLLPQCSSQSFQGIRFYPGSNELTKEENKKLYDKLVGKQFNEKDLEASLFAKFVTPDSKYGPPRLLNYDWTMKGISSWFKQKKIEFNKYSQRYITDRVKVLGTDIAVAHFVVYRGGAIRFRDEDNFIRWTNKREEYFAKLPDKYNPTYFVEAIDASDILLYYEGLQNFKNLYKLKWLSLKNNPMLDNWGLDLIGHAIPQLEYLDISDCPKITAAGIAGLQKLSKLKELVINNNNVEVQMACFALEDVIPGLFVTMKDTNNDTKLQTEENNLNVNIN